MKKIVLAWCAVGAMAVVLALFGPLVLLKVLGCFIGAVSILVLCAGATSASHLYLGRAVCLVIVALFFVFAMAELLRL